MQVPPRLRHRRGGVGRQEEAVPLPLARRGARRGAGATLGAQRRTREGGGPLRRRRDEEARQEGGGEARAEGTGHGGPRLMTMRTEGTTPASSLEVRARLVEALKLDLVGPRAGHALADERLPGWVRPSNWYLTGFLIPSGTPPEKSADADEDDDLGSEIPESAGLAEESNEERKAAKKGFFPSSMGLSFLVPKETVALTLTVRWGDYEQTEIEGPDGKPLSIWQRHPREATVPAPLAGATDPVVHNVPDSGRLQLLVVERVISAQDLEGHLPQGTRSVSVFLVNHRAPSKEEPDLAYVFQPELEVR